MDWLMKIFHRRRFITYYFDGDKLVKMTVTSELHTMTMTILK